MRWLVLGLCLAGFSQDASRLPQSSFLDVGGVRLHYLDWGGTGAPIVLVPGGCETPYVFGDLAALLTPRFRVVGLIPFVPCGTSEQ